jgi:hypothetical protein
MVGQIARDAVGGGRQEAAPVNLEVSNRGLVTAARIVARGRMDVLVELGHVFCMDRQDGYRRIVVFLRSTVTF